MDRWTRFLDIARGSRAASRLPQPGESSFNIVLKGLNLHEHTLKYGRRIGKGRHFVTTFLPKVPCLRRYYLAKGLQAPETIKWSYPPGRIITGESSNFYTVFNGKKPFASFIDAGEAVCFATVLEKYMESKSKVVQFNK